jgi:hypothetical protein
VAGENLVNLAANDYLGLAADPEVQESARQVLRDMGLGGAAGRVLCGTRAAVAASTTLRRRPAPADGGAPQFLDEGSDLTCYAGTIAGFLEGGRLTRLLLRRPAARDG